MANLIFDIETGPLPEEQLRAMYKAPTWEEFSAGCDQRWKEDTRRAKFEEAQASGWATFVDKAALSPLTGEVLAIGLRRNGIDPVILGEDGQSEAEQLEAFWTIYAKYRKEVGHLIGFNSHGFDLPFLVRRSWFHQIVVPETVLDGKGYFSLVFVDLMRVWGCNPRGGEYTSLDKLCRFFGIGAKPADVGGADFARLWRGAPEERQQAISYLANDLSMTLNLAQRMGVVP